jgi:Protein of unknown function (DUF2950)
MNIPDTPVRPLSRVLRPLVLFVLLTLHGMPIDALAAASKQQTFASPEQAAAALAAAWRGNNKADLVKIFGPAGIKLVNSGDAVADTNAKARLAAAYDARHKIVRIGDNTVQLIIGNQEFPYPIPLVKKGPVWHFDTQAGADEILDRRIGRNELNAIGVCHAYVEAQREYAARDMLGNGMHEYAQKIVSTVGKHDGLYWEAGQGEAESPLGPLFAGAADEGYKPSGQKVLSPYHGYFYKVLTQQRFHRSGKAYSYIANGHMTRGFAMVAYPAQYGNSGVMTFIVNQDGIVFEKNLGKKTAEIARHLAEYDPDRTWSVYNGTER